MSRFVKWFDHHHGCEGVEQDINVYASENNLSIINVCPYYFWGAYAIFEKVEQGKGADVVPKSEVAREIFDEIEKIIDEKYNHYIFGNNYLDDLEHEAIINYSDDLSSSFDELKKKYTEGQ